MKKKNLQLISPRLFLRLFWRSTALLILCITLIILCFYLILQNMITDKYRTSEYNNTYATLTEIGSTVRGEISDLNTRASEVLSNPTTASALVTPLSGDDTSRLLDISSLLENYVQKNDLVSDAWIYLQLSDSVLSSTQEYLPREDCENFPEKALDYAEQYEDTKSDTFCVYRDGSRYYMVTSYPDYTDLGVLVTAIDSTALYRAVSGSIQSNASRIVYLYDDSDEKLFPALVRYPSDTELAVSDLCFEKDGLQIYRSANTSSMVCCYTIEGLSWKLVQFIPSQLLMPSISSSLLRFLPLLLVAILVILAFSVYMIATTYRPLAMIIQRLLRTEDLKTTDTDDPWELIEKSLIRNQDREQHLSTILDGVAPAIHNQLFQNLLNGQEMDPEAIEEQLLQLHSPFRITGHYLVIAVQATGTSEDLDQISRNIYTLSLRSFLEKYWTGRCLGLNIQTLPDSCLIAVLRFEEDTSLARIQLTVSDFRDQLKLSTRDFAFVPQVGESHMITDLTELHAAGMEAQKKLHYRTYFQNSQENPDTSTFSLEENFFRTHTGQLLSKYQEGNPPGAEEVRSFLHSATLEEDAPAALHQIHTIMIEQLLAAGIALDSLDFLDSRYMENGSAFLDTKQAADYLEKCLPLAGNLLHQKNQSDLNNYVEIAKRFIAENYADSNLSQEMVCSHIGISTPYFSALFSEQEGQNFLSYVHQYRIEQARQLLFATDYTVAEIGYRTGFNSANSFIRVFKKLMNETPGKYRERIRSSR